MNYEKNELYNKNLNYIIKIKIVNLKSINKNYK